MLEVVREFALERLEAEGEAAQGRLAHARYFLGLALEADARPKDADASYIADLRREHANCASALAVLLESEPRNGARMAVAFRRYWAFQNLYSEGIGWAKRALESGGAGLAERASLLAVVGAFKGVLGDREAASEHVREAVEVGRGLEDKSLFLPVLNWAAVAFFLTQPGAHAEARGYLEEALAIARAIGDGYAVASLLVNLSAVASIEGHNELVRAYNEEALSVCSSTTLRATCVLNLGSVLLDEGDLAGAAERLREGLAVVSGLGERASAAFALEKLAEIALRDGAPGRAARLASAAESLHETMGGGHMNVADEPWERVVAKIRGALEPVAFEREWARGRAMRFEEVVEEALDGGAH
jgi:tetratricopeptide (TPR) repeat protein